MREGDDWILCEGTLGEGVIDTFVRATSASIVQAAHRVAFQEALGGAADALGVDAAALAQEVSAAVSENAVHMTQAMKSRLVEKFAKPSGVKHLAPREPNKVAAKLRRKFPAADPTKREAVNG